MITRFKIFEDSQYNFSVLRKLISSVYRKMYSKLSRTFFKNMEIEYDKVNKLYKIWVDPYNEKQLYKGKTGLSESHPKGKYSGKLKNYDYILLSKSLKDNDPYSWVEHEIGHILGYRAGNRGYTKSGEIIKIFSDLGLNEYPNTIDELEPFIRQMKDLKSKGYDDDEIIRRIMTDYEESEAHENDVENLEKYKIFFKKLLNEKIIS